MAPPPWDGVVQSQSDPLVGTHTFDMPTGTVQNDRVVVVSCMGRNRTQGFTWNDSFISLTSGAPGGTIFIQGGNDMEIVAAYRDMPSSPPASITGTPNVTKGFVGWAGRCPAGTFDPATAPVITWSLTSSNAPSLNPGWSEDTLFLSGFAGEEFDFATYPLPDDQAMRNSGQLAGAICTIGQTGGAALDLGPWAAFFDTVNGTILVAVRGAASGTDATATPGALAVAVSMPQASAGQSVTAQPAAFAAAVSMPQASLSAGATASPAALTAALSVPQASPSAGATAAPAALAAQVSTPQPSVGVSVAPSAIAASVTLPQTTVGVSVAVSPNAVSVPATFPAATLAVGSTVTPAALLVPVSTPQASPVTEGGAVATPAAVTASVAFPQAAATAQTVASAPALQVATTLPTPSLAASAAPTPSALDVRVTFPQASPTDGGQSTDPVAATYRETSGASFRERLPGTYQEPPPAAFRESA
jgi:hypothetical protein